MSNKMALDALKFAEAALADIGDADREPGDDLAWCEARAAEALPKTRAAIAALQAEPQGWRPIETAPKGAYALLWIDIAIGHPLVVQGCWFHDDDENEKGWIDLDGQVLNATHWMPLPTPPKD